MAVRSKREFADVLREAAKRAGFIDGASLADRTGINASTIRTWFRGESEPRFLQLAALAEIIHAPLDTLAYSDSSKIVAAVGEDLWVAFSESQRADILNCIRLMAKLNARLAPEYDPVAMFMANLKGTSAMCDSFIGKLPAGTVVAVDKGVLGAKLTTYDPPAGLVGEEPATYGKRRGKRK